MKITKSFYTLGAGMLLVAAVFLATPASAQVNYTGGTYTQNFDGLPSTFSTSALSSNGPLNLSDAPPNGAGATGMVGWTLAKYGGTGTVATFRADTGTSNSGSVYSYGSAASPERALGSIASGSVVSRFGVTFVNNTGSTITQFTLGYTGEQWRNGGNVNAQTLSFSYLVGATDINTGTFTAATALDFVSPTTGATAAALDGNATANRRVIAPVTITGLSWAPGQALVLRWTDVDDSGSDHGLAIDDLTFTAGVAAVAQTITFNQPADHVTTDAPFTLGATSDSGLTVTYTVDSGPATVSGNTLTLTGAAGSVVVRASQAGNSSYLAATDVSRTFTVTKAAQTITFPQPAAHATTDAPFTLSATSDSGLTVTFTVDSGPATVSGNTLTLTGAAGSVVVRASQAGNSTYLAATDVSRTIVVTTAAVAQTITFAQPAAHYTIDAPFTLSATSDSGLTVTFTVDSGPATVSGNTLTLTGAAGSVVVRASQAGNASYLAATDVSRTIAVTVLVPVAQTITFVQPAAHLTTDASFTLSATATSGLTVTFTVDSGPATVSGNTLTLTGAAGSVVVRASQAGNASYLAATDVSRTITVNAVAQTITFAQPAAHLTTDIPFTLSATSDSGLTVTFTVDSGPATVSGNTLTLTGTAGSVVVRASQAGNASYLAATDVSRTIAVNAPQTITFAQPAQHYTNDAPFTLSATASSGLTVTYIVDSGPATVSGNTLTLTGTAGSVVVRASQAGNTTYLAATDVSRTIPVVAPLPTVSFAGGVYTQNFDTLPSTGTFTFTGNGPFALSGATPPAGVNATGLTGWSFSNYGGTGTNALFKFDDGTSNAGSVVSYGTTAASDRALGSVASAAQVGRFGVSFVNTTSATITQFTLGYTGEQWRNGGNTAAQTLSFSYAVGATDINTGNFTNATTLDFISPIVSASGTTGVTLDGNLAANRTVIAPVTITGLSWAPGQTLVLRWTDLNDVGNDHALAIDDLTFSTTLAQTITFAQPAAHVTTDASFTLGATTDSGLTVTYTVDSGPATVSGNTLTLTGAAGSVVVRASQAGNAAYYAATDVTRTVTVTAATQNITFAQPATHYTADAAFALGATASSGLAVTYTVDSGPATVSGGTLTLRGTAGSVVVRASQAGNASYTAAADVSRTITVTTRGPQVLFGAFGGAGGLAVNLAPDGQDSTLIGYLPGTGNGVIFKFRISPDGTFSTTTTPIPNPIPTGGAAEAPAPSGRSAAVATTLTFTGQIVGGVITGTITELSQAFTATLQPDTGATSSLAGYYQAAPLNSASGTIYSIVSANGGAFVLAVTPAYLGGGTGTATGAGTFTVNTSASGVLSGTLDPNSTAVTGTLTLPSQPAQSFAGLGTATPHTDRLVNLSSRALITPGAVNGTLITGFVIGGTASKTVLLRAMGPALANYGVANPAADPQLRVYDSTGALVAANNDWSGASDLTTLFTTLGAAPLASGSKDAAVVMTLAPGTYTMHIFTTGTAGVALAEIYDASATPQYQRLVNISARGPVASGENVLIAGFVVTGNSPKRILVRGVGPGLAAYGVSGVLSDPILNVYRAGTIIAQNDNWETPVGVSAGQAIASAADLVAAAAQTGAFALTSGSKDAALIVVLAPGVYSAQVSGVNGATGNALIEVYELP